LEIIVREMTFAVGTPIKDAKVRCWQGGTGPDLVLLQGGMADAELHWSPVWGELEKHYRVVAPDLPGFGQTSPIKNSNWKVLSDWMGAFLDSAGISKPILVGNSFGGTLARAFSMYYPPSVSQLILVNGGGFIRPNRLAKWFLASPFGSYYIKNRQQSGISTESLSKMISNGSVMDEQFIKKCQRNSGNMFVIGRECVLGPQPHGQLFVPTVIIWGKMDKHSPLERAYSLSQELIGSRLIFIEDASHLPQLDRPEAFIKVLRECIEIDYSSCLKARK
jgi:pimeloyl-ACP methyl ester carboxylesterase